MPRGRPEGRIARSFRLLPDTVADIDKLRDPLGLSQAQIVELAVRRLLEESRLERLESALAEIRERLEKGGL